MLIAGNRDTILSRENVEQLFISFDVDQTGEISTEDVRQIFASQERFNNLESNSQFIDEYLVSHFGENESWIQMHQFLLITRDIVGLDLGYIYEGYGYGTR